MKRAGRIIGALLAGILGFLIAAAPAWAALDRTAAKDYSNRYSCNSVQCRNGAYKDFGDSDCTNFVSQTMKAGGIVQYDAFWPWQREWYYSSSTNYSGSWVGVSKFVDFMLGERGATYVSPSSMSARYTPASIGDVYMYDWGRGAGWSHLSTSPGFGTFPSYYDSTYAKNYNTVTGGTGDYLNQHSRDRYHAPWNWGYWAERDSTTRARMKTLVAGIP